MNIKAKSTWLNDKLQYQFIKVEDDNVAKMFEEYLINRDNPKENIVGKISMILRIYNLI